MNRLLAPVRASISRSAALVASALALASATLWPVTAQALTTSPEPVTDDLPTTHDADRNGPSTGVYDACLPNYSNGKSVELAVLVDGVVPSSPLVYGTDYQVIASFDLDHDNDSSTPAVPTECIALPTDQLWWSQSWEQFGIPFPNTRAIQLPMPADLAASVHLTYVDLRGDMDVVVGTADIDFEDPTQIALYTAPVEAWATAHQSAVAQWIAVVATQSPGALDGCVWSANPMDPNLGFSGAPSVGSPLGDAWQAYQALFEEPFSSWITQHFSEPGDVCALFGLSESGLVGALPFLSVIYELDTNRVATFEVESAPAVVVTTPITEATPTFTG